MTEPLFLRSAGDGPALVLVHGTAANADGWARQIRALRDRYRVITVDRRGTPRSRLPEGVHGWSVKAHAGDLVAVLEAEVDGPAVVVGSSFGAACVLELTKTRPDLVRGMVLCEPPIPPLDTMPPIVSGFRAEFTEIFERDGPAAATHHFLEFVLGPEDFAGLPKAWLRSAEALSDQIRYDVHALADYKPQYGLLTQLPVPALMVGGSRSKPYFGTTLERLRASLKTSARLTLQDAGHMMHLDQPEAFNRTLVAFEQKFLD